MPLHYYFFAMTAGAVIMNPRNEKIHLAIGIFLSFICYHVTLVLYDYIAPIQIISSEHIPFMKAILPPPSMGA